MKHFLLATILMFFYLHPVQAQEKPVELLVLYDNHQFDEHTTADWGFSVLVVHSNDTILFDTGTRKDVLFANMKTMNIDPKTIKTLVISHHHGDHTGCIFPLLEKNPDMQVFLPSSLKGDFQDMVENYGAQTNIERNLYQVTENIYLSGQMGFQIPEQCLIIQSEKGLIVLSACSHPGIDRMVREIAEAFEQNIFMVMGGFHLEDFYDEEVIDIIKTFRKYGVQKVVPGHCTGNRAKELLREVYNNDFIESGTGMSLLF
ncbi:MAG: MBL fold metallo-hydrolase [Bacteroidales bacterium]